jgi:Glycosyltransferase family 25 (LPS biosynthesis protein)
MDIENISLNYDYYLSNCYKNRKNNAIRIIKDNINNIKYTNTITNNIKNFYKIKSSSDNPIACIISIITDKSILENIICNFKDQTYENKKLFLIVNTNNLPQKITDFFAEENENDYYELFKFDPSHSIGYCINYVIDKLKNKNYKICAIFNNNCIYEPNYLIEQTNMILCRKYAIVGKDRFISFIPEKEIFYKMYYNNDNYLNYYGTLVFDIKKINAKFDETINCEKQLVYVFMRYFTDDIKFTSNTNFLQIVHIDTYDTDDIYYNKCKYEYDKSSCSKLINHLFDKIYVINLEHDTLMKNIFIDNNFRHNLNFTLWKGTYGKEDKQCLDIWKNSQTTIINKNGESRKQELHHIGAIGYMASILSILKNAKNNNYEKIIIFDDDTLLCDNFPQKFFNIYLNIPKDWNLIRLGSLWYGAKSKAQYLKTKIKDGFFLTQKYVGSLAVCHKNTTFDIIIQEIEKYQKTYDQILELSANNNDYTLYPNLVIADLYKTTTSHKSRNLNNCFEKLMWDFNLFQYVNTLRKVSIIVYFNNNALIIPVIQSILHQSYKNMEIIIINNEQNNHNLTIDYLKHMAFEYEQISNMYFNAHISIHHKNNFYKTTNYSIEIKTQIVQFDNIKNNDLIKIGSTGYNIYWDANGIFSSNYIEICMHDIIKTDDKK